MTEVEARKFAYKIHNLQRKRHIWEYYSYTKDPESFKELSKEEPVDSFKKLIFHGDCHTCINQNSSIKNCLLCKVCTNESSISRESSEYKGNVILSTYI